MRLIVGCSLAIGFIFSAAGGALADPAWDSLGTPGKSLRSGRTLPPSATIAHEALAPDEGHSFSGFYGGLHGGLATGHDATYGLDSHP